jgi:hypothetical protein
VVPVLLLCAGAVYFFAKPSSEDARIAAALARAEQAAAPQTFDANDSVDTEIVKTLLPAKTLSDDQTNMLIAAAGRRFERRKQAYEAAKQSVDAGKADASTLDPIERELDFARKICDVAESMGRSRELTAFASVEVWDRILAGGSGIGYGLTDRFTGSSEFTDADLKKLQAAFEKQYGRPLPISAHGDSASHRAMGFDHRGRIDVAVSPMQPEGAWLRHYLTEQGFTYFAFASAVRGKATGAHIHIGPPSGRITASGAAVRRGD